MAGGGGDSEGGDYWPGYVDALTAMVKVLAFVMMLLAVTVFMLSQKISKQAIQVLAEAANVKADPTPTSRRSPARSASASPIRSRPPTARRRRPRPRRRRASPLPCSRPRGPNRAPSTARPRSSDPVAHPPPRHEFHHLVHEPHDALDEEAAKMVLEFVRENNAAAPPSRFARSPTPPRARSRTRAASPITAPCRCDSSSSRPAPPPTACRSGHGRGVERGGAHREDHRRR